MKKRTVLFLTLLATAMVMAGCSKNHETADSQGAVQEEVTQSDDQIDEAKALQIALDDAQVSEADITNKRVSLEFDDGVQEYEVDFYVGNQEYDYDIDAKTGAIRSKDMDVDD